MGTADVHTPKEIEPMPEIAPLAVLIAFILNALSSAVAVDNAQMHLAYFEPGHRGNPGPAEIERPTSVGLSDVVLFARSEPETVEDEPLAAPVQNDFEHLAAPPVRPRPAAMPSIRACGAPPSPSRPTTWAPAALPLSQGNDGQPCQFKRPPKQTHESERVGYSLLNSRKDPS